MCANDKLLFSGGTLTPNDLDPKTQVEVGIVIAEMATIGFFGHLISLLATLKQWTWGKFFRATLLALQVAFVVVIVGLFLANSEISLYWKLGIAGLLSLLSFNQALDILIKLATHITKLPLSTDKTPNTNPLNDIGGEKDDKDDATV